MTEHKAGPNPLYREMDVTVDKTKIDKRTVQSPDGRIPIAISSQYPVERMDFWSGKKYVEILDHTKDSVDLSYSKDGMPFLDGHDTRQQVGLVEDVSVGVDGVLRGMVRFSQRQDAQDLKRDMLDGIKKKISVGYRQLKTVTTESKDDTLPKEVRVVSWLPMEASSVAIPADYSVGVGRSADEDSEKRIANAVVAAIAESSKTPKAPKGQERTPMAGENAATDTGAEKKKEPTISIEDRDKAVKAEGARVDEIRQLGAKHGIDEVTIKRWLVEGRSEGQVAAEILAGLQAKGAGGPTGKPLVELTEKERKEYSLQRAILSDVSEKEGHKVDNSFEREVSRELEKNFPSGLKRRGGILVPTFTSTDSARAIMAEQNKSMHTRAGLDSATSTKGAELKFIVPGDFLALIRNRMKTMEAGVTLMAGLQGPVAFPNQNAAGTATWVAENPGSDVADSNLTLQQIALNPKSIQSSTSYSRQLLAQSVIDVDGLVRTDLATIIAIALDLAVIAGTGASNQPTGITATAGIGSVAGGTNGLTPTYVHLVDLETQVTAASADLWPLAYMVHPTTRGSFKKATVLSNTVGLPVWQGLDEPVSESAFVQGQGQNGELNGYPAFASAQVPNNLTKGSSSGICLAILFGAWSQVVVGDWGMMEIIVDPYRLKKQGMIELTAFAMYGIAIKYPKAFAVMLDALA